MSHPISHKKPNKEEKEASIKSMSLSYSHYGTLPDKESIVVYNQQIPDGGDRLMKQVELQSAHRRKEEEIANRSALKQSQIGQWMGFILGLTGLCLSGFLIYFGHETPGMVLGGRC